MNEVTLDMIVSNYMDALAADPQAAEAYIVKEIASIANSDEDTATKVRVQLANMIEQRLVNGLREEASVAKSEIEEVTETSDVE